MARSGTTPETDDGGSSAPPRPETEPPYSSSRPFDPPPGSSWALLLPHVPQNARVLDVGCSYGGFASTLRRVRGCSVVGVEMDPVAAEAAREHCERVYQGDIAEIAPRLAADFDVVVAADVLEHLIDPLDVLRKLGARLRRGGFILASLPNVTHLSVVLSLAGGRFPRSREGLLDSTHLQFFGEEDVLALFAGARMAARIVDRVRTEPGSTEFHTDVRALPAEILAFLDRNPNAETYQFIARAVPEAWATDGDRQEEPAPLRAGSIASVREEMEKLDRAWQERGAWGQSLERDLAAARAAFETAESARLETEQRLTAVAGALQSDLSATRERNETLAKTLADREAQLARTLDGRLRKAGKFVRSNLLTATAFGAAVPFAAALGAAALAADGLSRVLPRKKAERAAKLAGPRLATIQILNYEGRELLERNLPSVLAAVERSGQPHRVVVVDNGSTDGSVQLLREKFPQVSVVPLDRNYFFSKGNNRGVPHSDTEILVLLNNDMLVEPDFLPPLLRPFDDPDVLAVSSQIFFRQPGKRREETGLTRARFEHGMLRYSHDAVPADAPPLMPILWGGGGSCAFDRRKWLELGGLDEIYDPFYCEDLDLSLRAWHRGWKCLLATGSKVWHEHRATSSRFFGEVFVNETFRRNSYLLHWANLRDPALFASHLLHLPFLAAEDTRRHGRSGGRSLLKAAIRAPQALLRRARAPRNGPSDRAILETADRALADVLFTEPKRLQPGAPLEIVMVTPYHFWPVQHGGAVRMYHIARQLAARNNRVSVVGFVDSDEQLESAAHLREFCADVRLLKRRADVPRGPALLPPEVVAFDQAVLHRELNDLIARRDPDVIQVEYTHLAPFGRPSPRAAVCLTEHDVAFVSHYRQAMVKERFADRAAAYLDYLRMFHFEVEALKRFDAVFTVSENDARLLQGYLRGAHVSAAGRIGVDASRFAGLDRNPAPDALLFVGFMSHPPNVDALLYFCRQILPLVHARNPRVTLDVIGSNAPREVLELGQDPRIRILGYADDLAPHYSRAALFVAPIRIAAGVRVKILEAFGAGVPVVSTPAGAEGLPVEDGRELALAASPAAFADRVLHLLADPVAAAELGANGRRLAVERFGWAAIAAELEEEYRAILRRKGIL